MPAQKKTPTTPKTAKKAKILKIKKKKTLGKIKNITSKNKMLYNTIEMNSIRMVVNENSKNDIFTESHFLEEVDVKKLNALIKSNGVLQEDSSWWEDISIKWTALHKGSIPNEKNFIKNLLHKVSKIDGKYFLKVRYFSKRDFGRVYPVGCQSLGMMRRAVRHFLCDGMYYDIDMVSAHQSILKDICEDNGIACPELIDYITNREQIFVTLKNLHPNFTRDVVKNIYIRIMYGSSLKKIFRDYKIPSVVGKENLFNKFTKFCNEIKSINMALYKIKGQKFYEKLTAHKARNKDGTFLSMFLQMWELELLDTCVEVAREKGLVKNNNSEIILCHDGFMIKKELFKGDYTIQSLVDDINFEINEEVRMTVKVKVKEFDEKEEIYNALTKQGISWTEEYIDEFEKKYGCMREDLKFMKNDDERISELFYCNQKIKYAYCDKTFYGLVNNGLFKVIKDKTFRNTFSTYMKDFIKELDRQELDMEEHQNQVLIDKIVKIKVFLEEKNIPCDNFKLTNLDEEFYLKMFDDAAKVQAGAKNKIRDKILNESKKSYLINRLYQKFSNDDFEQILDTDPHLLGFENGVWDCRTGVFRDAREGEFVSMSVKYKWDNSWCNKETAPEWLKEKVVKLKEKLRDMFKTQEDLDYMLMALSRCLKGNSNKEEVAHFLKGVGANGKSMLITLMRFVMGEYYYPMPCTYFSHCTKDNRDPTLHGAAKKRFIEVSEPNAKFVWNSDSFKRCTGNDIIGARNNYQTKDTHFKMGHIWCPANHFVRFNSDTGGNSMQRRIVGIEFPYIFKPPELHDEWKETHDKKYWDKLKMGCKIFKDDIESGYYNEAMMFVLMNAYKDYVKRGAYLKLTKNFKEDTLRYFEELSEDKAWFNNNIRRATADDEKVNLYIKSLREKHNEDQNLNWSSKWFCKKLREFYPDAILSRTNGFNVYGTECKGLMLKDFALIGCDDENE